MAEPHFETQAAGAMVAEKLQDVPVDSPAASSTHSKEELDNNDDGNDLELTKTLSHIDTSDFPSGVALFSIMAAVGLSIFLVALDLTIVATAIPRITDEFHSLSDVGWYGSAFFLTVAAFQATWGKAYKYFPLKPTYLLSIFVFELGSLICAVSKNSTTLIVGRAVAGAGGAGLSSGTYTVIGFSAPPSKRPAFTGVLGAVFTVASVVGPLLGGVFTSDVNWRWCFYINLPIGAVVSMLFIIFFRTPKAARPQVATLKEKVLQMDVLGSAVIISAAVCYLLAMQWGGTTKSWSSGDVVGTLVGFGILVIIFVAIEYFSGDRALIQGRLIKDRTLMGMSVFVFVVAGGFFTLLYYLPIYFQSTRGVSASHSGIDNLPLVAGAGIFSIISGVLITVSGLYSPWQILGTVLAAVGAGLLYTLQIHTPTGRWIGYQILAGSGLGLVFQVPVIVSQAVVKPSDLSSVSAMILFFQTIGGAIFVSAAEAGFTNRLVHVLPHTAPGVDMHKVIVTGASDLRTVFTPHQLPGILDAYMAGLRVPFAIVIVCLCLAFVVSFVPRWENIKDRLPMKQGAGAA